MSSSDSFWRHDLAVIGIIAPDRDLSLTRKQASAINGAKRNQTSSPTTILTDTQLINEFATRCLVHGTNIYAMERHAKVSVPKQHEFMYAGVCADAKRCETIDQLIEHFRGYHYDELIDWFYESLNKVTPDTLYHFTVTDQAFRQIRHAVIPDYKSESQKLVAKRRSQHPISKKTREKLARTQTLSKYADYRPTRALDVHDLSKENLTLLVLSNGWSASGLAVENNMSTDSVKALFKEYSLPNKLPREDKQWIINDYAQRVENDTALLNAIKSSSISVPDARVAIGIPINLQKYVLGIPYAKYFNKYQSRMRNMYKNNLLDHVSDRTLDMLRAYANTRNVQLSKLNAHELVSKIQRDWREAYSFFSFIHENFQYSGSFPDNDLMTELRIYMTHNHVRELEKAGIITIDYDRLKMSKFERVVYDQLTSLGLDFIVNDRDILDGREIDFVIPDLKIGIEVSPSSSHHSNQHFQYRFGPKDNNYHYQKFVTAEKAGCTLIQLFDFDLCASHIDKTMARLAGLLKPAHVLGARQTEIKPISVKIARDFCDAYHQSGYMRANDKYGVYHRDELVAVFTITKKNNVLDLTRFAIKHGYRIAGLTSKIIAFMKKTYSGQILTTFSDNNWGAGSSYGKAGMTLVSAYTKQLLYVARDSDTRDTYSWSVNSEWGATSGIVAADRKSKGLPAYADEKFDIEEYIENSLSHRDGAGAGYDRIYTAGSRKWRIQL